MHVCKNYCPRRTNSTQLATLCCTVRHVYTLVIIITISQSVTSPYPGNPIRGPLSRHLFRVTYTGLKSVGFKLYQSNCIVIFIIILRLSIRNFTVAARYIWLMVSRRHLYYFSHIRCRRTTIVTDNAVEKSFLSARRRTTTKCLIKTLYFTNLELLCYNIYFLF